MAARSAHEAISAFQEALCAAFSCVTNVVPHVEPYNPTKDVLVATLRGDDPVIFKTSSGIEVGLIVTIQYRVINGNEGWIVQTAAYEYALTDRDGHELLTYHWHPDWGGQVKCTHLHLQHRLLARPWDALENKHLPTGRVAFEDLLESLLSELEIKPNRLDWQETFERNRAEFERVRSWAGRRPPVQE